VLFRSATVIVTSPPIVLTSPPQVIEVERQVIVQPLPPPTATITDTPVPTVVRPVTSGGSGPPPTQQTPFYGWERYQSIHLIGVTGTWAIQTDYTASANQFRRSVQAGAIARFPFTGDGIRLRYGVHEQACAFDLYIDDVLIETLNGYAPEGNWRVAGPYFVNPGYHVLDVRSRADLSNVCGVDIDYMEVFIGPPSASPAESISPGVAARVQPTVIQQDVSRIQLISAPATPIPTATGMPASVVTLSVSVAYDENANGTVDLDEGVSGVSVRVVSESSGELLEGGFTDERGTARLQIVTHEPVVAHVPLLNETLVIRPGTGGTLTQPWVILLDPVNQPAVIP
jgi:hypothetical protein